MTSPSCESTTSLPTGGAPNRSFSRSQRRGCRRATGPSSCVYFAISKGASLLKPAHKTDYGGYSGYFGDPDNHPWEVVVAPGIEVGGDRRVHLPD